MPPIESLTLKVVWTRWTSSNSRLINNDVQEIDLVEQYCR